MHSERKIEILRNVIDTELTPLIKSDYVLWGLPYYLNIGDTLIWQGELDFLQTLKYKCKGVCPWNDYPKDFDSSKKIRLANSTTILITGGGYFGDTWREGWENVLDGIKQYPDNPIVLLPQTIYYNDKNIMNQDKRILSSLKNLTICVRDKVSYELAKNNYGTFAKIVLMPDMAFYINSKRLKKWVRQPSNKKLYLKRMDKEAIGTSFYEKEPNVEVRDWPTMEQGFHKFSFNFHDKVILYRYLFEKRFPKISYLTSLLADYELYHFFRPELIRIGVEFISSYKSVRTTRLHVLILSILLGKDVTSEDNSYGKLSSFYETWLSDVDHVHLEKV